MARPPSAQPTEVELEILQVLWEHGPCALGQIHLVLSQRRDAAYSSTRKMVQVMREKGLVVSKESVRPNLYRAARSREKTQMGLINDLARRAFGGSTKKLVMSLLAAARVTPDELQEMQQLVTKAKAKGKKP